MKITILTMFPQMFDSFREGPVVQRAIPSATSTILPSAAARAW